MTTRTDVAVDFNPSPRVALVADPSTEFLAQDVVDTLRVAESSFTGMSYLRVLDASGKEDLGAGRAVGITATQQDLLIAFEARKTPAETGTVTTGSSAPTGTPPTISFIDTNALFESANVQRGSFLINFTDQSVADVVEVVSETELVTTVLVNGSDNEWDISDDYQCFNIIQCNAGGGNLVAVDDLLATISPILPTAFTQVLLERDTSAVIVDGAGSDPGAVWDELLADHTVAGSFGEWVGSKLLSVVKFLGLK
jgi:hypothetical protein